MICSAKKKDGVPCRYKATCEGQLCGIHYRSMHKNSTDESLPSCPICLDVIEARHSDITKCSHTFHKKCLKAWMKNNDTCPCCRKDLTLCMDSFRIQMCRYRLDHMCQKEMYINMEDTRDMITKAKALLEEYNGDVFLQSELTFLQRMLIMYLKREAGAQAQAQTQAS